MFQGCGYQLFTPWQLRRQGSRVSCAGSLSGAPLGVAYAKKNPLKLQHGGLIFSSFSAGKHSGLSPKYENRLTRVAMRTGRFIAHHLVPCKLYFHVSRRSFAAGGSVSGAGFGCCLCQLSGFGCCFGFIVSNRCRNEAGESGAGAFCGCVDNSSRIVSVFGFLLGFGCGIERGVWGFWFVHCFWFLVFWLNGGVIIWQERRRLRLLLGERPVNVHQAATSAEDLKRRVYSTPVSILRMETATCVFPAEAIEVTA